MRLKKGTKVRISPKSRYYGKHYQLPIGIIGMIEIDYNIKLNPYIVKWGRNSSNSYNFEDLIVVDFNHYLKKL